MDILIDIKSLRYWIALMAIFLMSLLPTCVIASPHYAAIVVEYPSKKILFSENPETLNQPASLAKIMTLYLVFQALNNGKLTLNQPLYISKKAANRQPSKLGLKPNQFISVEEAICGLATKSANDAATVIAENLALSEDNFGRQMTTQARLLGMKDSIFVNASGIAVPKQQTTAVDMAILGSSILRDFPTYYHYFSLREFRYRGRAYKNHNHLLGRYPGCDGIKTGFTIASGFNLVSSAVRNGHRIIAVILGGKSARSRDARMMQIMNIAFAKLEREAKLPLPAATQSSSFYPSTTSTGLEIGQEEMGEPPFPFETHPDQFDDENLTPMSPEMD